MKTNKLLPIFTLAISSFLIASCGEIPQPPKEEPPVIEQDPNKAPTDYVLDEFGIFFKGGSDISLGTHTINGITYETSDPQTSAFNKVKGAQIGTSKKPQTSDWNLTINFSEEVYVTSYFFDVGHASGGEINYKVNINQYNNSGTLNNLFDNNGLIEGNNISYKTTSITLSMNTTISKAIYFRGFGFSLYKAPTSTLDLVKEEDPFTIPLTNVVPGTTLDVPNTNYKPITKEEYYVNIDFNKEKTLLEQDLHTLLNNYKLVTYGESRYMLQYTDESITNPGHLYGMYDGEMFRHPWMDGYTWNREHVWSKSHLQLTATDAKPNNSYSGVSSDLHNLRACGNTVNSSRGNKYFDNATDTNYFYPNLKEGLDFRGDAARILFYMDIMYTGLSLLDDPTTSPLVSNGKLNVLLEWNKLDPVDNFEIQRNNRIYEYQGNRNPFIDYSETLATKIYSI